MKPSIRHGLKKSIAFPLVIGTALAAMSACGTGSASSALSASRVTKIAVDYACEETSEATKWLEVGLHLEDRLGTVEAIVVEHNDDASPNNRIPSPLLKKREKAKFTLDRSDAKNIRSVFIGTTVKLSFDKSMSGELSITGNESYSRKSSKVDCFKNEDGTPRYIKFVSKN